MKTFADQVIAITLPFARNVGESEKPAEELLAMLELVRKLLHVRHDAVSRQ